MSDRVHPQVEVIETSGDTVVARCVGPVEFLLASDQDRWTAIADKNPVVRFLIVDMSRSKYWSDFAASYFPRTAIELGIRKGAMVIVGITPKDKVVMDMLGQSELYHFEPTVDAAKRWVAAQKGKSTL